MPVWESESKIRSEWKSFLYFCRTESWFNKEEIYWWILSKEETHSSSFFCLILLCSLLPDCLSITQSLWKLRNVFPRNSHGTQSFKRWNYQWNGFLKHRNKLCSQAWLFMNIWWHGSVLPLLSMGIKKNNFSVCFRAFRSFSSGVSSNCKCVQLCLVLWSIPIMELNEWAGEESKREYGEKRKNGQDAFFYTCKMNLSASNYQESLKCKKNLFLLTLGIGGERMTSLSTCTGEQR